ncbi:hypothetical protein L9F63_021719, partial [Diploptera punctata]
EVPAKNLSPITRFRALVRRVINNLSWLSEITEEGLGSNIALNVRRLRQKKTPVSGLTYQIKTILMKPVEDRTDEEKHMLYRAMNGLKCFRRYPDDVKRKLTAVAGFVTYGPGRVVVRQGQYAHATYFISSGDIKILITSWDELHEAWVTKEVGTMGPGDMFGEVSLLHDVPRTATCVTSTECSFLFLDREHFVAVLKETLMGQWDECKEAMHMFPYFDGLSDVAIRECCILSRLSSFPPNKTIIGYGKGKYDYTHFILSGECQVIEELKVVVLKEKGNIYPQRENLTDRSIITLTPVKCLMCPSHWINRYNLACIWDRIRHYFRRNIPTKEQVYKKFIENRHWLKYQKKFTANFERGEKLFNPTTINDVPLSIRLHDDIGPHRHGYQYSEKE